MNKVDPYLAVQRACELRLAEAEALLYQEESGDLAEYNLGANLAGPFCGCTTCVVREVLDAARPYFPVLAEYEKAQP